MGSLVLISLVYTTAQKLRYPSPYKKDLSLWINTINMKGYIALCLVIILSMGLTESQKIDEKAAQKILENYSKNPTSSSNSDLEKAYRANCCDVPNNRGTGGLLRRQKRAGPICRWIKRVKEEIQ